MKRFFVFVAALFLLCLSAFAYSVPSSTTVYVTPTGSKYHRKNCSYTTTVSSMTIQAAEQRGYTPCSRCDPDDLTGQYGSNSSLNYSSQETITPKKEAEQQIEEYLSRIEKMQEENRVSSQSKVPDLSNGFWDAGLIAFVLLYFFLLFPLIIFASKRKNCEKTNKTQKRS